MTQILLVPAAVLLLILFSALLLSRAWRGSRRAPGDRRLGDLGRDRPGSGDPASSGLTRRSFVALSAALGAVVALRRAAAVTRATTLPQLVEPELPPAVDLGPPWAPTRLIRTRVILPMSSGIHVSPGQVARITARPQFAAVRPDRIVLSSPGDWWIEDIRAGGVSLLDSGSGGVPGDVFSVATLEARLVSPVLSSTTDFSICARYVGGSPTGAPFVCGVLCDAVTEVADVTYELPGAADRQLDPGSEARLGRLAA